MEDMSRGLFAVFVALAACGDDGDVHHLSDAPTASDAAIDAATSGPVTLAITFEGTPRAGIDVYFLAADGSLVAKAATDAQGVATATMMAGGSVTAVNPFPAKGGDELKTIGGVKPGDQLQLKASFGAGGLSVTLRVPDDPNATQYDVFTTCGYQQQLAPGGGSGAPATGTVVLDGCVGNLTDLLIVTIDAVGDPSRYLFKPGIAVADQGTIDLSAETYVSPVPTATLTWSNVPAPFTGISFHDVVTSTRGPLLDTLQNTDVTAGAASATIARPATTQNALSITSSRLTPTDGVASQYVVDWGPAGATAAHDLGSALLGKIEAGPTFLSPRLFGWTAQAGSVSPDFSVARVVASRTDANGTQSWTWDIAVPYMGAGITMPKLPVEADRFNFVAGDVTDVVDLTVSKVPGGYDAVRAQVLSAAPEAFAAGASGRLVYERVDGQVTRHAPARNTAAAPFTRGSR